MSRSCFLKLLLVSSLMLLSFSSGFGRNLRTVRLYEESSTVQQLPEENIARTPRGMTEVTDYEEPGPNTNWSGFTLAPPPQTHN